MRARCALSELDEAYGPLFIHVDSHLSEIDPFATPETEARADHFGVTGVPEVDVDGVHEFIGASICDVMVSAYDEKIREQLQAADYLSPVDITGGLTIDGNVATVTADLALVDPGLTFDAHQVTLFLVENDITWCCGYGDVDTWSHITRMVRSTPVTLNDANPTAQVVETVTIPADWNVANLHAAAVYEEAAGGRAIVQATDFQPVPYYFVTEFADLVESVPSGNGEALFTGVIRNVAENGDVLVVTADVGTGWPAEFQVEGDPNWYTSTSVALEAGESKAVTLRVLTDGDVRIGLQDLSLESQFSSQLQTLHPRVFNGSHSILLVDDDGPQLLEEVFVDAFAANGYLHSIYSEGGDFGPTAGDLVGYDAVVWHTALFVSALDPIHIQSLETYLDGGGGLFLSSMGYLSGNGANPFTSDYLGVASYTNDVAADEAYGVDGDPITNGMVFPALIFPGPSANRVDEINPTASANTIFRNENGLSVALRNTTTGGARTVYNSIQMDAFGGGAEQVIGNTLYWILNGVAPAAIEPGDEVAPAIADDAPSMTAFPNPFSPSTEIRFALASADHVSLVLVDAAGRKVRTLVSGVLAAGPHGVSWDGNDDAGIAAPAGVYFARMRSAAGESEAKIVRAR
ncbi:MAG: FlgD immunoglobulin-like domain containing protein [Candidatus Eisenbacteria bacterium]